MPKLVKFLQFNAAGVAWQRAEILHTLQDLQIDLLAISKTFLNPHHFFSLPGFTTYRRDRDSKGGGVLISINNSVAHSPFLLPKLDNIEAVAISLKLNSKELVINSIYNSSSQGISISDINKLLHCHPAVYLLGDFNAKHPTWNPHTPSNQAGYQLFSLLSSSSSCSLIAPNEPTRPSSGTIIDIGFSTAQLPIVDIQVLDLFASDHLPVLTSFFFSPNPSLKQPRLRPSDCNISTLQANLSLDLSKSLCNNPDDIDVAVDHLINSITSAIALSSKKPTPKQLLTGKLPPHILSLIKQRTNLKKQYNHSHSSFLKFEINKLQKEIKAQIQDFRNDSLRHSIAAHSDNPYFLLTRFTKPQAPLPPLTPNASTPLGVTSNAAIFAHHLTAQFTTNLADPQLQPAVSNFCSLLDSTPTEPVSSIFCSSSSIQNIIKTLRPMKAPGPDNIPASVLQNLPIRGYVYIANLLNACFRYCYFPSQWKTAKIFPLHKHGKPKNSPENYRPISLLNILSKVFEPLFLKQSPLTSKITIYSQPNSSAFASLILPHNSISPSGISYHSIHRKQAVGLLSLDLRCAFDQVWHNGFLYKLYNAQFPFRIIKLLRSFLSGRKFYVTVDDQTSSILPMPAGVPQGSVLAPILFSLYLYDIPRPSDHRTSLYLYADDTALSTTSCSSRLASSLLQKAVEPICAFFSKRGFSINSTKTKAIMFIRSHLPLSLPLLSISNHSIPRSPNLSYLGLVMDPKLKFQQHLNKLVANYTVAFCRLYPLLKLSSSQVGMLIYKTFLRSRWSYAAPIWFPLMSTTRRKKLQILQNKALRVILQMPRSTRIPMLHQLAGL